MNLQQLEYIIAVHKLKNFTRAAEFCNVTQATLSAMIKKLEEELDVKIFDRKKNPIVTTDEGSDIVLQAQKVIHESAELRHIAQRKDNNIAGNIKIGIIPTIANSLLPKILKPILTKYPELNIELFEITTENIVKQLKDGLIDIGIMATPLNDNQIEENILYYEMLLVYGEAPQKEPQKKQYILPDEIKQHKVWMLEEGHCLRDQFIHFCDLEKKTNIPGNFSFEANSFETLLAMIDEFGGLTLIPELYYQNLSQEKRARIRFFKSPIPVREVSIVYYRPFAKLRIIKTLTDDIINLIQPGLMSREYKNSELEIVQI